MLNARQVILGGLVALLSSNAEAAQVARCPAGGQLSSIADSLSDYPPAIAYCTLQYPRQAPTQIVRADATTVTETVTTNGGGSTITSPTSTGVIITSTGEPTVTVTQGSGTIITSFAPFSTVTSTTTFTTTSVVSTDTITSFTATTTTTITTTGTRTDTLGNPVKRTAIAEPQRGPVRSSQSRLFSSLTSASPSPAIRTACKCLQRTRTVTDTRTPTSTVTVTSGAANNVAKRTVTTTVSLDGTTTTTITPITTATSTITASASTTVTVTTTTVSTATATYSIPANGPDCSPNATLYHQTGVGGCSGNCYCDLRSSDQTGTIGFCDNGFLPAGSQNAGQGVCTTDKDCPNYSACLLDETSVNYPQGTCSDFTGCTSDYDAATGTFGSKGPAPNNAAQVQSFRAMAGRISAKKSS